MADTTKTDWTKLENWSGGINPNGMYNVTSTPVLCKDGTTKNQLSSPMGKYADACVNNGGRANQPIVNAPVNVPSTKKQTFLEKHQNHLIMVGVPLGFYAFSKYKKYDDKKTAKVTIIGSVVVLGLVVLNGFSGAWTGTTFMDRTFGKQKYW